MHDGFVMWSASFGEIDAFATGFGGWRVAPSWQQALETVIVIAKANAEASYNNRVCPTTGSSMLRSLIFDVCHWRVTSRRH